MSRNEIIETVVNSGIVPHYVDKYYHGSYREDVIADLYLIILHMPPLSLGWAHLTGGMGGVFRLVAGVLKRQLISTSSYIYTKYTRHERREQPAKNLWPSEKDDSQDE